MGRLATANGARGSRVNIANDTSVCDSEKL